MKIKETVEVDFLPPVENLPDGTYVGIYSATTPQGIRYARYEAMRDFGGVRDTETGFTRAFLNTLPRAKCRGVQRAGFEHTRPPLYVSPGPLRDAVYVDIKAAYPTLYGAVGWGVEYLREKYYIKDKPLLWPYPPAWKIGRSYVVTGARPMQTSLMVKGSRLVSKVYRSPFSNPSLVTCIYDTLGALGRLAVGAFGARYWNIDGGIMTSYCGEGFSEFLKQIGINAQTKYKGDAFVYTAGLWYVGDHLTKLMDKPGVRNAPIWGDRIPVSEKQAEWIIKYFARER